jgi:16S rRNA (guanine527-N7)-methyltransferase
MSPFGLSFDSPRRESILRYAERVATRAQEFNLVSKRDLDVFVEKHVGAALGSLLALKSGPDVVWVDVGSGAGLPGLVLKIWAPEHAVALVEASGKRCLFLEETARALGLDVAIHQKRGEEVTDGDLAPSAGTGSPSDGPSPDRQREILMRAVSPLDKALAWVPGLLRPGDRWHLYGGPDWRIHLDHVSKGLASAGLLFEECLEIPWAPGRLLIFRRLSVAGPGAEAVDR